jgi:hypothetical protein
VRQYHDFNGCYNAGLDEPPPHLAKVLQKIEVAEHKYAMTSKYNKQKGKRLRDLARRPVVAVG